MRIYDQAVADVGDLDPWTDPWTDADPLDADPEALAAR